MGNNQLSILWNRDAKDLDSLPAFRPCVPAPTPSCSRTADAVLGREQPLDEIVREWKALKDKIERAQERRAGIEDAPGAKSADVAVHLGEIDREIEDVRCMSPFTKLSQADHDLETSARRPSTRAALARDPPRLDDEPQATRKDRKSVV